VSLLVTTLCREYKPIIIDYRDYWKGNKQHSPFQEAKRKLQVRENLLSKITDEHQILYLDNILILLYIALKKLKRRCGCMC
jgi:hypothetical protein